jgi:hypothetical protein
VRENSSYVPSGLANFPLSTHGLRRGLHSCAASRLNLGPSSHGSAENLVLTPTLEVARAIKTKSRSTYTTPVISRYVDARLALMFYWAK